MFEITEAAMRLLNTIKVDGAKDTKFSLKWIVTSHIEPLLNSRTLSPKRWTNGLFPKLLSLLEEDRNRVIVLVPRDNYDRYDKALFVTLAEYESWVGLDYDDVSACWSTLGAFLAGYLKENTSKETGEVAPVTHPEDCYAGLLAKVTEIEADIAAKAYNDTLFEKGGLIAKPNALTPIGKVGVPVNWNLDTSKWDEAVSKIGALTMKEIQAKIVETMGVPAQYLLDNVPSSMTINEYRRQQGLTPLEEKVHCWTTPPGGGRNKQFIVDTRIKIDLTKESKMTKEQYKIKVQQNDLQAKEGALIQFSKLLVEAVDNGSSSFDLKTNKFYEDSSFDESFRSHGAQLFSFLSFTFERPPKEGTSIGTVRVILQVKEDK